MAADLTKLYSETKTLASDPDWKVQEHSEYCRLTCPLDVRGVTIAGLRLGVLAHILMPDRSVSFQLEYLPPAGEPKGGPLSRIDWRPQSPHNNKGIGPEHLRYTNISGCHVHPFSLNWNHSERKVVKGLLPIAIPIEDKIDTYQDALAIASKEFNISGMELLPVPPWTSRLL